MLACSSLVVVSRGISPIKKYLNFRLFFHLEFENEFQICFVFVLGIEVDNRYFCGNAKKQPSKKFLVKTYHAGFVPNTNNLTNQWKISNSHYTNCSHTEYQKHIRICIPWLKICYRYWLLLQGVRVSVQCHILKTKNEFEIRFPICLRKPFSITIYAPLK